VSCDVVEVVYSHAIGWNKELPVDFVHDFYLFHLNVSVHCNEYFSSFIFFVTETRKLMGNCLTDRRVITGQTDCFNPELERACG